MLRHLTSRANVGPDGRVLDPVAVRHGVIDGARVGALAGPIDQPTHLNLDFPGHRLDVAIVAEALEIGAPVVVDGDHFLVADVDPSVYVHLGYVDVGARRADWQLALRRR